MKAHDLKITRRQTLSLGALALGTAALINPRTALAAAYREITWDDLVPPGVPYSEIIGEGEMDERSDTWKPVFDANGTKLNKRLNGVRIKMPGYIIPLEQTIVGVTEFILVPYQGACIHVPPPPPNQLVLVNTKRAWGGANLFDAVWVYGTLRTQLLSTSLADIGYGLSADKIELYEW